jgi:hypothetical protein
MAKHLQRRFIRTGLEDGTQVQVLSGLTKLMSSLMECNKQEQKQIKIIM